MYSFFPIGAACWKARKSLERVILRAAVRKRQCRPGGTMSNDREIRERLERLEQSGRRWKCLALLLPVVLVALAATAAPVPDRDKVIKAQSVLLQDDKGKTLAELVAD